MRLPDGGGGGTSGGHGPESASSTWDGGNSSGREGVVDNAFQRAMNGQGDYNFVSKISNKDNYSIKTIFVHSKNALLFPSAFSKNSI
jgi:hypothetical protein